MAVISGCPQGKLIVFFRFQNFQAMLSCVIPSEFISGGIGQRIEFPQWLGKHSKRGRLDRILQELQSHMRLRLVA